MQIKLRTVADKKLFKVILEIWLAISLFENFKITIVNGSAINVASIVEPVAISKAVWWDKVLTKLAE